MRSFERRTLGLIAATNAKSLDAFLHKQMNNISFSQGLENPFRTFLNLPLFLPTRMFDLSLTRKLSYGSLITIQLKIIKSTRNLWIIYFLTCVYKYDDSIFSLTFENKKKMANGIRPLNFLWSRRLPRPIGKVHLCRIQERSATRARVREYPTNVKPFMTFMPGQWCKTFHVEASMPKTKSISISLLNNFQLFYSWKKIIRDR